MEENLTDEVMLYIEAHLTPLLTVKSLAVALRKHPSDLDRFFRRATGKTIKQHIDERCRERVIGCLRQGDCKGTHLAMLFGFRSDQAFYRWVHRVFGVPFRELQQEYLSLKDQANQTIPNQTKPNQTKRGSRL